MNFISNSWIDRIIDDVNYMISRLIFIKYLPQFVYAVNRLMIKVKNSIVNVLPHTTQQHIWDTRIALSPMQHSRLK